MSRLDTRRLPVVFAAATVLPIAVLGWLGVRTLDQDRALAHQRRLERLDVAAAAVALDIERDLERIEQQLTTGRGIRLLTSGIAGEAEAPILFQPEVPLALLDGSRELEAAEALEYRDVDAAIILYRRLAASSAAPVRGEALVALGGLFRHQRQFEKALAAYAALEKLDALPVAGNQPAALVAMLGRGRVLEESADRLQLRAAAETFARILHRGGWRIDRVTFDAFEDAVKEWGGPPVAPVDEQRTHAAIDLWRRWRRGDLTSSGRNVQGDGGMLAIWTGAPAAPIVALLSPGELQKRWRSAWESRSLVVSISTSDGTAIFGRVRDGVSLERGRTRLPFVLSVTDAVNSAGDADLVRRGALASGIALAALLMTAASYGLYRITISELRLARQQSDFVAAVSHEFRTPLTSMRHLLDLLIARGIRDEERKTHYYRLLAGETDRLTRMVETLLSFGRMDAGGQIWMLEPLDVVNLVSGIVETFRSELTGRAVVVDVSDDLPHIRGDREALSRALWNLLENAAKYSPVDTPIRVFVERSGGAVVLGVEDRGIGIPIAEQRRVFDKFVRGDEAKRAGIRGVGVGLALVKRIAEAHGGSVRLTSEVGKGSTFTLVLPVAG